MMVDRVIQSVSVGVFCQCRRLSPGGAQNYVDEIKENVQKVNVNYILHYLILSLTKFQWFFLV